MTERQAVAEYCARLAARPCAELTREALRAFQAGRLAEAKVAAARADVLVVAALAIRKEFGLGKSGAVPAADVAEDAGVGR